MMRYDGLNKPTAPPTKTVTLEKEPEEKMKTEI
jgi:hypothetical protein